MKFKTPSLLFVLISLVFLTSSFDVFLNLKIAGFSVRFSIVVMIILILIFIVYQIDHKFKDRIKLLGYGPFFIWFLFLLFFIPNTTILSRNIGYMIWLSVFTGFIILLPCFIRSEEAFLKTIRIYLLTFTLVAIFGLVQFAAGLAGIKLLTEQYWLDGKLPRINAFSYEPSYFTTYIFIAWITFFFLIIQKSRLTKYFNAQTSLIVLTVSLLLSTSRMGLAMMFLVLFGYTIYQIKNTMVTLKIKKKSVPVFSSLFTFLVICVGSFFFFFEKIKFMFVGLGLFGYAGHSSEIRFKELLDTLEAFWRSPIIGYSLGGIPSAIARLNSTSISTQVEAKEFEGMNIFAETLAASGIFGFVFFMSFLCILFYKTIKLVKTLRPLHPELSQLLLALLMGLLFELLLLNMNQNILRTYLWVHIGIVNLGYFVGKGILNKSLGNSLQK